MSGKQPSTPAHNRRLAPPHTPGTSGSVTSCTADAASFNIVTIHTAKCTVCDERNSSTMRRCPGCTWQICQRCYDKCLSEGKSMIHGNTHSPSVQLTPANRRKLLNPTTGGRTPRQTPQPTPPPVRKEREPGLELAAQATPMTATSSRKRDRKAKHKAPIHEASSSDEFVPEPDSPTADRKRQKTAEGSYVASGGRKGSSSARGPGGQAISQKHKTPEAPLPSSPPASDLLKSVGRPLSTFSDLELMQTFGVDTKENPYEQHLLGRATPVLSNPVIKIPENVRRGFKPRKTAEEMQKDIVEGVRGRLEERNAATLRAQSEAASASRPAALKETLPTLREFVIAEARDLQQGAKLDEDQQETLVAAMKKAARIYGNKVYDGLAQYFRVNASPGLDMLMAMLADGQKAELMKLVRDAGHTVLKEEASMYATAAGVNPIQQAKSTLVTEASSSPAQPPVGFFHVTPTKYKAHPSLGAAMSPPPSVNESPSSLAAQGASSSPQVPKNEDAPAGA